MGRPKGAVMSKFFFGSSVRVKQDSPSPYRGCTGVVIKVIDHDFVTVYEVKMDSYPDYLTQSNRLLEDDLESY
ncbi:hypothetical protein ACFLTQ_02210 [Chloroflexota bacterium]